ncbi:hypothetical protein BDR03DRAFT_329180 [Suillus americanus]|nr:hypothetical protein BDR03DRAFT_329180 [Suillus americanus]
MMIHVPRIYSWYSDVSNHVEKVLGCQKPNLSCLVSLILHALKIKVPQSELDISLRGDRKDRGPVTHHHDLLEMFVLRFESAGSLYFSLLLLHFVVGPIFSTLFYRALNGIVLVPNTSH